MGKADLNKQKKRESLLETAFELFTTQGVTGTSISDIVEKAGVAKGTFYLYFKDKYDIRNRLIAHKSSQLFHAAYEDLASHQEITVFEDRIIFICDHILDALSGNRALLSFISKDLSWGVFKRVLTHADDGVDFKEVYNKMIAESGYRLRDPEVMLFMIVELVGSTCFSAILYEEPADITVIKPYLFNTIRAIIREHEA